MPKIVCPIVGNSELLPESHGCRKKFSVTSGRFMRDLKPDNKNVI